MNASQQSAIERMRTERTVLNVELTAIARKGGSGFAGLRGVVDGGDLNRFPVFLPASTLGARSKRMQNLGAVDGLTTIGCIADFNQGGDKHQPTLVLSEQAGAVELALINAEIVTTIITRVASPRNSNRVAGFSGEIRHAVLSGAYAFFPVSQIGGRGATADGYVGEYAHGVIIERGKTGGFVLSESRGTQVAFERTAVGQRLFMKVTSLQGETIFLQQAPQRGVPLQGRMDIGALRSRAVDIPEAGSEVLVLVTGKQPAANEREQNLLLVTIDNSTLEGNPRGFCVECQKMHDCNGLCQDCNGCLYKHSHQIWEGNGSSIDGCFFRCEICGSENFWD